MAVNLESGRIVFRLWFMIHHIHDLLATCESRVFNEYNLTPERYAVLITTQYLGDAARPVDVARWLGRSPNSVSMIVDRMVKAGLLKRTRDRGDRRVVRLSITNKGENAVKSATGPGSEFVGKILSPLSSEDKRALVGLLERVEYKTLEYLNPGADVEDMIREEGEKHADLFGRLLQYTSLSSAGAQRRGGRKGRTK